MKITVLKNYDEMSRAAAEIFKEQINKKPDSVLGLATGSTPIGLYKKLIEFYKAGKVDFSKVITFNLDEYVGLDEKSDQSYKYFMAHNLFNYVNVKKENIHIPDGCAKDMEKECIEYSEAVENKGGIDLQILGIGNNGHIGFNEPSDTLYIGTHITNLTQSTIKANSRFFNSIDEVPTKAITMGMGGIMKAKKIILLVSGKNKAKVVKQLIESNLNPLLPASILKLHSNLEIILDEDAASMLNDVCNLQNKKIC